MTGHNKKGFEKSESNLATAQTKLAPSQLHPSQLGPGQLHPSQLHASQLNQPNQYYTGDYMTNPYKQPKSSSCTYVIVFLFVILMVCAIMTGVYLTNKVDDVSDGSKTTKELGKLPNKLLNLGKNLIDDLSTKLDHSNSSLKVNSSRIIQDNKINLNEVSNFASNLFKKINDTINEKLS